MISKHCENPHRHRLYHATDNLCPCLWVYIENATQGRELANAELSNLYRLVTQLSPQEKLRILATLSESRKKSAVHALSYLQTSPIGQDLYEVAYEEAVRLKNSNNKTIVEVYAEDL